MALEIHQFPCLQDNFGVLIHDTDRGVTASIDAPETDAVRAALKQKGWTLSYILTTHHHADHTDGNLALKADSGCVIIGPKAEAAKIPGIDSEVADGNAFRLGSFQVQVLDTPGHTNGHISFYIPQAGVAFVGDTMFALGCGRVIEGTNEMMWSSLAKLIALPPATRIYCGHEYTLANAKFSLTIEPENETLVARAATIEKLRAAGNATLPTTIGEELATSPFVRVKSAAIRKRLNLVDAPDWQVFAEVRTRKNKA